MFLVENSAEIIKGTFVPTVIEKLNVVMPHFVVDVVTVDLLDLWPLSRHRCYLRGMRRDAIVDGIPAPIQSFGKVNGASFDCSNGSMPRLPILFTMCWLVFTTEIS